ncbi:hypothetical protein RPMA_12540 [Tardiphaga alba]|uniref:Chemotaxis protein n=1 Tax=Tardiphaga alba TaxID=340268 RepID=A0ABX8AAX5_9BRAD|nr:hypothetical protein [Tardiphaga alba]QUS39573.1 hypothetical protein RPMA_12540 [Tardiphaga alba]
MGSPVGSLEGWGAIAAIIGGGGISGILIAIFGYLSAARGGRKGEPERAAGVAGISALMADSGSINGLTLSIDRLALSADKVALITIENRQEMKEASSRLIKLGNDMVDEVRELRRAVEDAK